MAGRPAAQQTAGTSFVPRDFVANASPADAEFMLAPLRVDHLVLGCEVVISSPGVADALDERLCMVFGGWLAAQWPFSRVARPRRDRRW